MLFYAIKQGGGRGWEHFRVPGFAFNEQKLFN